MGRCASQFDADQHTGACLRVILIFVFGWGELKSRNQVGTTGGSARLEGRQMKVEHGTLVMVADGAKLLLLRNQGG